MSTTPPPIHANDEERAWELARVAHADQVDKDGAPYIDHVRRVVEKVRGLAPEEMMADAVVVAILHDVVEDSAVTVSALSAAGFGDAVVRAVDSVSRRDGEPYMDLIERATADPVGRWVKLADNLDNSDEDRLGQLDDATAQRLRDKYAAARDRLTLDRT